ncbi:MAG: 50S ribosomal protein L10 [Bryobacterales bacterium]|nr:50S ribosomal protein L10 [Bryobacterales bacterium]
MKRKEDKKKDLEALRAELEKAPSIIIGSYEKMKVAQDFALRKTVREVGGHYKVVKNNIAALASQGTPSEPALKDLKGMTSVAYTHEDPVALAKALAKFAKENPLYSFRAGVVEGRVINMADVKALAEMPSKEELFSRLLYLINAPATMLARTLNGVGRNLAVVVDQGVKEEKFKSA